MTDNLCPWCGEDVSLQGGLEAHMSEPCEPYLSEQPEWMREQ